MKKRNTTRKRSSIISLKPRDRLYKKALESVAHSQVSAYNSVYPFYNDLTKDGDMMFAAVSPSGTKTRKRAYPTKDDKINAWLNLAIHKNRTATIKEISARQDVRGHGTKMMNHVIDYCARKGMRYVYLVPLNDALRDNYYPRFGFVNVPDTAFQVLILRPRRANTRAYDKALATAFAELREIKSKIDADNLAEIAEYRELYQLPANMTDDEVYEYAIKRAMEAE